MKYKRKLPDHLRPTKSKKNNAVKSGRKNKVDSNNVLGFGK